MPLILIFIFFIWLARSIFSVSRLTYYWQLKEYRLDRFKEFFLKQGGYQLLFSVFQSSHAILLVLYGIFSLIKSANDYHEQYFPMLVSVLLMAELFQYLHQAITTGIKRPKITLKSLALFGLTLGFEIAFLLIFSSFSLKSPSYFFSIALTTLVEADLNLFALTIIESASRVVKRRIFLKAQKKRMQHKNLIVIGITGSFGKTSVKEFLSHILSRKFKVLKTEKNTNTEIGISQTILKKLSDDHEVFVCEMGAYKRGEITTCCQIARPKIGILTGLNEQHLALFGSLDKTFQTKWELMTSLPQNGVGIINGECQELKTRITAPRCLLLVPDFSQIANLQVENDRVKFMYKNTYFEAPLIGRFQAINLLMSITAAEFLGMTVPDIATACRTIKPPEKTMILKPFSRGFIIDDSYNVNPDGLQAALLHLDLFEDYIKVIFFPGILELGKNSDFLHQEFGAWIAQHTDYCFLHDMNFSQKIRKGALQSGLTQQHIFEATDSEEQQKILHRLFQENPKKQFVILFESRGAEKILEMQLSSSSI